MAEFAGSPSAAYTYRSDVLEALERHGVRPQPTTNPEMVRGFVRDLYKFQLKKLRDRVIAGEIAKRDYAGHVDALRRTYPVLSLQPWQFLAGGQPCSDGLR